jgi:hypothetical protein
MTSIDNSNWAGYSILSPNDLAKTFYSVNHLGIITGSDKMFTDVQSSINNTIGLSDISNLKLSGNNIVWSSQLGSITEGDKIFTNLQSVLRNSTYTNGWSSEVGAVTGIGSNGTVLNLTTAALLSAVAVSQSDDENIENELTVSSQRLIRRDGSTWLVQSSENRRNASILLSTISNDGSYQSLGLTASNGNGILGWTDPEDKQLTISAAAIYTSGRVYSGTSIGSSLLYSSDHPIQLSDLPSDTRGYFTSASSMTTLRVVNTSDEPNASARVVFSQQSVSGYLGTSGGSVVMQSNGTISFIVGSNLVGGFTQTGGMFVGTNSLPSCAAFAVTSKDKGGMLPRMTTNERLSIKDPEEGLEVYDLDRHKKFLYTNVGWEELYSKKETRL